VPAGVADRVAEEVQAGCPSRSGLAAHAVIRVLAVIRGPGDAASVIGDQHVYQPSSRRISTSAELASACLTTLRRPSRTIR
jgi:hypothetical protein